MLEQLEQLRVSTFYYLNIHKRLYGKMGKFISIMKAVFFDLAVEQNYKHIFQSTLIK